MIRTAGTNCDEELIRAFDLAGAAADPVHLERVIADPGVLESADLIGFPGGFSYGDDIASGRVFAAKVRASLYPALRGAVDRGACIIGVCNGFQVLVQAGLLPGPDAGEAWPETPAEPVVTLTENESARFIDRWIGVEVDEASPCVWTRGLGGSGDGMVLPIAHAEGRFVAPNGLAVQLASTGRVALRYRENVNGSEGAIAGICDTSGRVFGLMPHPERYLSWDRHPISTRLESEAITGVTPGLRMFQNAVEAVSGVASA
ncbi:MAG: phosphoribosylformylglycinamidine synthase subunit PurQ [Planctomycetota bacterium]